MRQPSTGGNRIPRPGQPGANTDDPTINTDHPSSHGVHRPDNNDTPANRRPSGQSNGGSVGHPASHGDRRPGQGIQFGNGDLSGGGGSRQTGQNGNTIRRPTPKANRVRNPTRRRPLRPVAADKIDVVEVEQVATGEILGANQWNTFDPTDPTNQANPGEKTTYQLEDGSIVRIPVSRPGRPTFQRPPYRRPFDGRPTEPAYTEEAGLPVIDPSGPNPTRETFFDGSLAGRPTPEIINGDVRQPPIPPTTKESQTYDPVEEYEDTFPSNPSIEVSSDGYNGFNDVGNNDFEERPGNNGQTGDNGAEDGNAGYPGVGTSTSGNSGNVVRPGGRPGPTRGPYRSSEYVNEVRYPNRQRGEDILGDGERSPGEGNFLKIPVEKSDKNENIFAPTRETPATSGSEGAESGRQSEDNGEIDLSSFYDAIKGEEKSKKKRRFETSSTKTTFSTRGEPTFINIDHTKSSDDDEDTGRGSVIITTPTEGSQTSSVGLINPVRSTSFNQATTSAVSLKNEHPGSNNHSLNVFKFPQRPKPQPSLGAAPSFKHDDNISDNEVIHNNLGAAIVEQVLPSSSYPLLLPPSSSSLLFPPFPSTSILLLRCPATYCRLRIWIRRLGARSPARPTRCARSSPPGTQAAAAARASEREPTCLMPSAKVRTLVTAQTDSFSHPLPAESRMYQIEVLTTSESQETRIVHFNPQAVQRAVEESFKNRIQVSAMEDAVKWRPCTIRFGHFPSPAKAASVRRPASRQILIYMSSRTNLSDCYQTASAPSAVHSAPSDTVAGHRTPGRPAYLPTTYLRRIPRGTRAALTP